MSDTVICVEGLGKRYRIGAARERYVALRDVVTRGARSMGRRLLGRGAERPTHQDFWALKDVSFEVKQGECVGIIGHNGAGKSTLLKLLSRITEPTEGRFRIRGRVASLLEVGTGFHPELTGRENVYLNGSILGMSQREIDARFEQIVGFAELEKFLDTPVKYYSSGMYMRLAFAVAAHLEPEILVVDEVLAVGDSAFQKKCLGKMGDVAQSGRTVLFVSHQLAAITSLCRTAIQLQRGAVVAQGPADRVATGYLASLASAASTDLASRADRSGSGVARLTQVTFLDGSSQVINDAVGGEPLIVRVSYTSSRLNRSADMLLSCYSATGEKIFHVDNEMRGMRLPLTIATGQYSCRFSRLNLPPGQYQINALLQIDGEVADHVFAAATLNVLAGDYYGAGRIPKAYGALVFVDHEWC